MKKIVLMICGLIAIGMAYAVAENTHFERPSGQWTDYIVADPNLGDSPAQHFLCGVQYRQKEWAITVREYAGRRWFRKRYRNVVYRYYEMTNAINLIFCRSTNWSDQI